MAKRESIEELEVGDHLELPAGQWHTNHAAKAIYAKAVKHHEEHGTQFEVEDVPGTREQPYQSHLVRIR